MQLKGCLIFLCLFSILSISVFAVYEKGKIEEGNKLIIQSVSATIDSKVEKQIDYGSLTKYSAKPGSDFMVQVDLFNKHLSQGKDLQDIFVELTLQGIDNGEDIILTEELETLGANRAEAVQFPTQLPSQMFEGTYTVSVLARAYTNDGKEHAVSYEFEFEVKRDVSIVRFTENSLDKKIVSCDRNVVLTLELVNIGSKYQKGLRLDVRNEYFDLQHSEVFDLNNVPFEEGTMHTVKIPIAIPMDLAPVTYHIRSDVREVDTGTLAQTINTIQLQECPEEEVVEEKPKEEAKPETPKEEPKAPEPVEEVKEAEEEVQEESEPEIVEEETHAKAEEEHETSETHSTHQKLDLYLVILIVAVGIIAFFIFSQGKGDKKKNKKKKK